MSGSRFDFISVYIARYCYCVRRLSVSDFQLVCDIQCVG